MKSYFPLLLLFISCEKTVSNKILSSENVAIKIAEQKFNEVYGKETMSKEKPLTAKKINDSIYFVEGTFNKTGFGGVAYGEVDIKNKIILNYSHGK